MKVSSAVVVLLSLLVLCDLAYSAPNCGDNGIQDLYASKYCNCFSGYAPSDRTQKDCNDDAQCPFRVPLDSHTSAGGYQPMLFNTSFKADRYNVVIRVPIVEGRRNATVRYAGGEETCGYPGNLWIKQVNSLDCFDEIIGSMPWTSHVQCGFNTKTVRGTQTTYSATLQISYSDIIKDEEDGDYMRTITTLLKVNVTFTTTSKLVFNFIDLTAGNTYVKVSVVGDVLYDANNIQGSVTLRTKATWPYTVEAVNMFKAPFPNTAAISTDVNFNQKAGCTNVTKSDCTQQYVMRITPNGGCNIGGNYVFNITLGCRTGSNGIDICGGASYTSGSYTVRIFDTDICGVGGVDVSLANGQLLPFSDREGNTPSSSFLPNAWTYFSFSIQSDAATIDQVSVDSITASTTAGVSDQLFDGSAGGATVKGVAAGLAVVPAGVPVAPGTPATLWFQVQLVDAISSFRVLPSSAATVTMTIIVNVQYRGNSKRTIQAVASVTTSKGLTDIYISGGDDAGDNLGVTDSGSSLSSPISPLFFFVLALVLMTALRY